MGPLADTSTSQLQVSVSADGAGIGILRSFSDELLRPKRCWVTWGVGQPGCGASFSVGQPGCGGCACMHAPENPASHVWICSRVFTTCGANWVWICSRVFTTFGANWV
eukprot:365599-Chlamydomonas_euryale.AAC.2